MNTRLQVEHPVTELITGVDLVEQMIRVAAGERLAITQDDVSLNGWAIESRLYAEDPYRNFLPSIGRLTRYRPPEATASSARVIRNDTGVFEGGEISRYYDPMIAKLCAWAPDRAGAIEAMRSALDAFEVEGIGHNLPFLAAVMDHPRFVAGDITTAFIAEEFPDGFAGAALPEPMLRRLAALAAHVHAVREDRASKISGAMRNHSRNIGDAWVVVVDRTQLPLTLTRHESWSEARFDDGGLVAVACDWTPGQTLARAVVDNAPMIVKLAPVEGGWRMRCRGADLRIAVLSPRHAELAAQMPVKAAPDTSKQLLCPMPGLVMQIHVSVGDEIHEGQALCMIEAMKMENVLRAERKGVVQVIHAAPGASMAVDDVIMEFE